MLFEALSCALEIRTAQCHVVEVPGFFTAPAGVFHKMNNWVTARIKPMAPNAAEFWPVSLLQTQNPPIELYDFVQHGHRRSQTVMMDMYRFFVHFKSLPAGETR